MSTPTPELGLLKAVDADDTADYLVTNLANSLTTVDSLYNAVSGHTHNGAHQGGPIGSVPVSAIPDGSITSAKIADGTIVAADIAAAGIANNNLGPDVARANQLVNGGFENWQRGNGPFTTSGAKLADRWYMTIYGTDTLSVSKSTTGLPAGSQSCAVATFTLGTGSGTTIVAQDLSIPDGHQILGLQCSLSVLVKTTTANAVRVAINNYAPGPGNRFTYSGYHSGSGNWESLTASAICATDTTYFCIYIMFSASCTAYLDNAMLVVGSQPANYVPLPPADDLARCLRYYEILTAELQGYATSGINVGYAVSYKAHKPVAPTVTKTGTWTAVGVGQPAVTTRPSLGGAGADVVTVYATTSATGAFVFNPADATCGITIEANPLFIPVGLLMMQWAQPDYVIYGIALVAAWMVGMDTQRAAHLARQLRQLPGFDRLVDRLRCPTSTVRTLAFRMLRPVLTRASQARSGVLNLARIPDPATGCGAGQIVSIPMSSPVVFCAPERIAQLAIRRASPATSKLRSIFRLLTPGTLLHAQHSNGGGER
ncbi:MAG: hypothetical protein J2P17_29360 [Mycobacterium sp.]|nr:hypothetical protein [Mycobacterium sp.]